MSPMVKEALGKLVHTDVLEQDCQCQTKGLFSLVVREVVLRTLVLTPQKRERGKHS